MSRELSHKAYATIRSYHLISNSILLNSIQRVVEINNFIDVNSPLAATILHRQTEAVVEFLETFSKSEKLDTDIIHSLYTGLTPVEFSQSKNDKKIITNASDFEFKGNDAARIYESDQPVE